MVPITRLRFHAHYFISALFFMLFILAPGVSRAQVARMEILQFQSVTLSDKQFLSGEKDGKPVTGFRTGKLKVEKAD